MWTVGQALLISCVPIRDLPKYDYWLRAIAITLPLDLEASQVIGISPSWSQNQKCANFAPLPGRDGVVMWPLAGVQWNCLNSLFWIGYHDQCCYLFPHLQIGSLVQLYHCVHIKIYKQRHIEPRISPSPGALVVSFRWQLWFNSYDYGWEEQSVQWELFQDIYRALLLLFYSILGHLQCTFCYYVHLCPKSI